MQLSVQEMGMGHTREQTLAWVRHWRKSYVLEICALSGKF